MTATARADVTRAIAESLRVAPRPSYTRGDWEIAVRACGVPDSIRLLSLISELSRRGCGWVYVRATNRLTEEKVETIASGELGWQINGDSLETGAWDEARQILWASGGRPFDVTAAVASVPSFGRSGTADERRHLRVNAEIPVTFGGGEGVTQDVSLGGAFLKTDTALEVSQRIIVAFTPPRAERPCFLAAEVVRTVPSKGVAVRFVHQNLGQLSEVHRAVNQLIRAA